MATSGWSSQFWDRSVPVNYLVWMEIEIVRSQLVNSLRPTLQLYRTAVAMQECQPPNISQSGKGSPGEIIFFIFTVVLKYV